MKSSTLTRSFDNAVGVPSLTRTDPSLKPAHAGAVGVRILSWQKNRADHAHARQSEGIHASLSRHGRVVIHDVEICRAEDEVPQTLAVPSDVLVVCCHSGWYDFEGPDEEWTELLNVELSQLSGAINANAVIFVSCNLAGQAALSELVARPTPAVACETKTKFIYSPQFVATVVNHLVKDGRPADWALALQDALSHAQTEWRKDHPHSPYADRWGYQLLKRASDAS